MGRPVTTTLTEIAEDERAGTVLRMSAIRMLGLLPWEWSHGARNSIPMLVESLDDGAVCMKTIGCPGGAFEATVADEAVRLLDGLVPREELDRRPLDSCSHSDATPWKAWWKHRHSEKRAVGEDAD